LVLMTTYQNNKIITKVQSLEVRSNLHCETNQCYDFPTQVSKFYENPSYVSCFLVGILPRVYHLGRIHDPPPPIEVDGE
jgi:hypothetical protein